MNTKNTSKKPLAYIGRVLLVLLLIVIAFGVGTMIGYSMIGDGENPMDIFDPELWKHILNFIFK